MKRRSAKRDYHGTWAEYGGNKGDLKRSAKKDYMEDGRLITAAMRRRHQKKVLKEITWKTNLDEW